MVYTLLAVGSLDLAGNKCDKTTASAKSFMGQRHMHRTLANYCNGRYMFINLLCLMIGRKVFVIKAD